MTPAACNSWYSCADQFQTLYSGVLAVAAALIAFIGVYIAARIPVEAQAAVDRETSKRRRRYACVVLASDFQLVAERARQAEGTINNIIAALGVVNDEIKRKTRLSLHPIIDEWESMSLLPNSLVWQSMRLRQKVHDHNFDIDRAGGAFGSQEFQRSILSRVRTIQAIGRALSKKFEEQMAQQ